MRIRTRCIWLTLALNALSVECVVSQTRPKQDVELLHQQLIEAKQWEEKARIAATILKSNPNDGMAQAAIEEPALEAVRSQSPSPEIYEGGKLVTDRFPADFVRWCEEKGTDPKAEFWLLFKQYPLRLYMLPRLPKPKAWPILVEGLKSTNPFVAAASASVMAWKYSGREALREIRDALSAHNGQSRSFEDGALYAMTMIPEAATDQETQALLKRLGLVERFEKHFTARQASKRIPPRQ